MLKGMFPPTKSCDPPKVLQFPGPCCVYLVQDCQLWLESEDLNGFDICLDQILYSKDPTI